MIVPFVDVGNESGLQHIKFSNTASRWRIDKANNASCVAHQQQVIINIGFKKFDVLTDANAQTSKCPVCLQYVLPKTCALITAYGDDGELISHKVVYHRY